MIYIVTGPVGSGKTTSLLRRIRENAAQQPILYAGIAAPVRCGSRYLLDLAGGEERLLDAAEDVPEKYLVTIGRYAFDERIFSWGCRCLHTAIDLVSTDREASTRYLVIDEIGPLELSGRGLSRAAADAFEAYRNSGTFDSIIIVRESLVAEVIDTYGLDPADTMLHLP